jgi:hypothetical protein
VSILPEAGEALLKSGLFADSVSGGGWQPHPLRMI